VLVVFGGMSFHVGIMLPVITYSYSVNRSVAREEPQAQGVRNPTEGWGVEKLKDIRLQ